MKRTVPIPGLCTRCQAEPKLKGLKIGEQCWDAELSHYAQRIKDIIREPLNNDGGTEQC